MGYVLEIKDIYKTFNAGTINEKRALNGVNLNLNPGDFVTIIGGNGAGKSTTANVILNNPEYKKVSGKVVFEGEDISDLSTDKIAKKGSVLGLDAMCLLMQALGDPQEQLQVIHVAGTNGKGSTCAMLQSILCLQGYRVGLYTSPAVFCYEERFSIDGAYIDAATFNVYMHRMEDAWQEVESMVYARPFLKWRRHWHIFIFTKQAVTMSSWKLAWAGRPMQAMY